GGSRTKAACALGFRVPRSVGHTLGFQLRVSGPLRRRLGDLGAHLDVPRHGVLRHAREAEVVERALVDARAGARNDHHLDVVLTELARDAVRRRLQNTGELVHDVLYLPRTDVFATTPHGFLLAARVVEVPILVAPCEIAGVEPAIAERVLGLVWMIEVV